MLAPIYCGVIWIVFPENLGNSGQFVVLHLQIEFLDTEWVHCSKPPSDYLFLVGIAYELVIFTLTETPCVLSLLCSGRSDPKELCWIYIAAIELQCLFI